MVIQHSVSARGSRVRGKASVRRVLRALPDATRNELVAALESGGPDLQKLVVANTPDRTGALRAGIKWRVLRASLRLQVGLLGTKRGRAKLFYGFIQDIGRKAQQVRVTRRTNTAPYLMRVRGMAGKHFVSGRYPDVRRILNAKLKGIWEKAIRKAAVGGGDD